MVQVPIKSNRIVEFDWLKMFALVLLIFVHSDLYFVFPEIIFPTQWFLVSSFFFVSGFLAYASLHKRGASIQKFLKTKIIFLYGPFIVVSLFYSLLQVIISKSELNLLQLLSQVALVNLIDVFNSAYNWDFLWFIPYLLFFMILFSFLEKYIINPKIQITLIMILWLITILTWTFDISLKLGQVFSQYFLIFIFGFWLNKFSKYEKITKFNISLFLIPLFILFSIDFSNFFSFETTIEALKYLLYTNGRSVIFSLSAILLVLFILRKIRIPRNSYVEWIARISILIYFLDPFFGYLISNYVFMEPIINFDDGMVFWYFILIRLFVLFLILPVILKVINNLLSKSQFLVNIKKIKHAK